jgi:hypothetical protein
MAITRNVNPSTLGIKVEAGLSATGAPLYKTVNFGGVKAAAIDQDVYDVAVALGGLQTHALAAIIRTDIGELITM